MLREDKKAGFVREGLVFKRRRFVAGKVRTLKALKEADYQTVEAEQGKRPVRVCQHEGRSWWCFHGRFYWEDEGLSADDVMALALQKEKRMQRQLERARDSMLLDEEPVVRRDPISTDVQRAVWQRDGGRCVKCGGRFNIQYDHIIPFSMGGASTAENLQILCGECNREKGASIG